MDFDSYLSRLADLHEFLKKNLKKPKKSQQKRFQKWVNVFTVRSSVFRRFEKRKAKI